MILDGCIWVGLAGGVMDRQTVIAAAGEAPVFTSAITLGELRAGVDACSDPAERAIRAACLRQVESQPVLGVGKDTAAAFGVLHMLSSVGEVQKKFWPRAHGLIISFQKRLADDPPQPGSAGLAGRHKGRAA